MPREDTEAEETRPVVGSLAVPIGIGTRVSQSLIYVVFAAICLILALSTSAFFTSRNLMNILQQASFSAIVAVGMTFVILTAGIDLSVGGVVALTGVLGTMAMVRWGVHPVPAIAISVALGAFVGLVNGVAVTRFNLPPFIATLAMWFIAGREGGAAFLLTAGRPIWNLPDSFVLAAGGLIFGIPVSALVMLLCVAVAHLVLTRTSFGRSVYAVGGNEQAARLSGIPVDAVKAAVYIISGALAGLSSMLLAARLESGDPKTGVGMELDAIAAVVIGGTSLFGGVGTVLGTLVGALVMGVISNGLNLHVVDPFWQPLVKGAVILLAVFIDQITKR
jgi:ribose/xylose/arabinose/galactoside ABC-type transport system permease subunit